MTLPFGPVLLVCLSTRFGGADVRVLQTAAGLHGRVPYAVATMQGSPLHRRLEAEGLKALPLAGPKVSPRLLLDLLRAIRAGGYAVVDAHNPQSQILGLIAARLAGVPVRISTVHHVYAQSDGSHLRRTFLESVLRLDRALGCRFLVVSEEIRASLLALGIAPERITLSLNGIALPTPLPPALDLPATFGWPAGSAVIGVFGRLVPRKGHGPFLEALARLARQQPALRALIVGSGPLEAELQAQVRALGLEARVHFTGFRDDVMALMRSCDVVCQPSRAEGLPYSILEAASLARPLVVTAIGDIPSLFRHGETARLLPPGDVAALARELAWCAAQPRAAMAMGEAARDLVAARLSPARMLEDTFALYAGEQPAPLSVPASPRASSAGP